MSNSIQSESNDVVAGRELGPVFRALDPSAVASVGSGFVDPRPVVAVDGRVVVAVGRPLVHVAADGCFGTGFGVQALLEI